jgi:phosphate transport system substrate-binding protein
MKKLTVLVALFATLPLIAQDAKHPAFHETNHAKAPAGLTAYKPVKGLSGQLRSVGADTMEAITKNWLDGFAKLYPDVKFTMEAKASGTAGPALVDQTADLGPVAREMLPNEVEPFVKKYGYKPFAIKVAGGSYRTPGKTHAIAFLVNAKNPIEKLTYAQLDAMFSVTRKRGHVDIKTWGDVGLKGDWADKPIHLWGLIRPNGIANFVQERVLSVNDKELGDYKSPITERTTVGSLPALDAIAQGVAGDPYAIGYSGFSNVTPEIKAVALSIGDSGPFYKGTFEEVAAQKYPLSRVIYIYVNRAPGKPLDPKLKEFLKYVLSKEGQEVVEQEGVFLPLPLDFVKQELKKLE